MCPRWATSAHIQSGAQTAAPNQAPTPAVIAIASAPQKVTRQAPGSRGAPPTRAAMVPNSAKKISAIAETQGIRIDPGVKAAAASGNAGTGREAGC
jgi:hypothetical protein